MVSESYARTSHTLPSWPSRTASHAHFPTRQTLAVASQLPLTSHPPSMLASREQTLCACPSSSASAFSFGVFPTCRTSMIVSLPPDTTSPWGCSGVGFRKVRALTNAEPCDKIVQSYEGGSTVCLAQKRTVASRDAERITSGWGKRTPRTLLRVSYRVLTTIARNLWTQGILKAYIVVMAFQRGRKLVFAH